MIRNDPTFVLRWQWIQPHRAAPLLALALCFVNPEPARAEPVEAVTGAGTVASAGNAAWPTWLQDPWTGDIRLVRLPQPDTSLWNPSRIEHYEAALEVDGAPPLGVLTIDRLGLRAPIYNGTDEFNLNRGLGRIQGMARIDEMAHLGVSGHRDGFFRVLKDLETGDRIVIDSPTGTVVYEVEAFSIVDKNDPSVLREDREDWRLTLVTCYPFYFVGNAPQRFIVHANPLNESREDDIPAAP